MCSVCYVHDEWTGHHGRSTSSVGTSGLPRQSATENSARCLQHNGLPGDLLLCIISAGFNVSVVLFTRATFCIVLFVCSVSWLFCVVLLVPLPVIGWKDSSPK